ncbi:MAG: DNA repair protein RecO [Oscillospiraceae bacterium]|nr:DNA repair protein RecO [Oscillospiraceae bacterium]
MYEKTLGIVLRETDYKEKDKLLTLLTAEYGKITVRARGVRGAHSKSKAACQLLAYSEFTLFEQQGRYTATETLTKEIFPELRSDIELLALASYFAQVTDVIAQENDPAPELLSLLLNGLYALSKLKKPQMLVKAVFELRMACISGFLPDLRGCAICGKLAPERFNISQGFLQCASCNAEEASGIRMPISFGTLQAMRYICSCDSKKLFSFQLGESSAVELSQIAESYLSMRLERGFYTLDFYKSLFY